MEAPRVFISHASEDKERFVLPFATQLRALGLDAWVDQWEIQAGDSLVAKVFDDGVDHADAFVVVLSHVCVTKPWVREELDAAVIRRIQSERAKRIVPILLDDDVRVPAALQHLKWSSVPRDGLDSVVRDVAAAVFGTVSAPALGIITGTADFAYGYDVDRAALLRATEYFSEADDERDGNFALRIKDGYDHGPVAAMEYTYNGMRAFWAP